MFQVSQPMPGIIENLTKSNCNHPTIILLGQRGAVEQTFIVVEDQAVPVVKGFLSAVDKTVKLYYVLQMKYPDVCSHVLVFLQKAMFNISDDWRRNIDINVDILCNVRPRDIVISCFHH